MEQATPIKEVNIFGSNRFAAYTKCRTACRGIVIKDRRLLLGRDDKTGIYMLPGGGTEMGETLQECCIRELCEETGEIVEPLREILILNEYYEEYRFISHFFVCRTVGHGERNLTEAEKERGLTVEWMEFDSALAMFSKHADDADDEERRGIYLREYTALREYTREYTKDEK